MRPFRTSGNPLIPPKDAEPMGDAVHTWIWTNENDAVAVFKCIGGPRDGLALGVPWDREQAKVIMTTLRRWLDDTE